MLLSAWVPIVYSQQKEYMETFRAWERELKLGNIDHFTFSEQMLGLERGSELEMKWLQAVVSGKCYSCNLT